MGRKQSHKKDVKAEKAKVKLKQSKTKFLPKGQNVTNTTFKVKSIIIPEQLKEKGSEEPLSKRQLNVKDLLSRMKHYNTNVKQAACEELCDMIKVYTDEIVQQYLSQVCLAISSLMQDKEHKVRKAAAKSVAAILEYVPNEKLHPFYNYFSINLRCAMTNIDKNIQEDSLLFLDCFIHSDGELIKKSAEKLLPDFFSLISKLKNDSDLGRTLTLNLSSKHTSVAWRIKVLSRLHAVLKIILGESYDSETEDKLVSEVVYDCNTAIIPLYKDSFGAVLDLPCVDIFTGIKLTSTDAGLETINKHIVTLVPLLYETWLEVSPEVKKNSEHSVLNEEGAALLSCIMNTLYLLWKYVIKFGNEQVNLKSVFLNSEGQKFMNQLLNDFPYCQPGGRVKKGQSLKILEKNCDPKCLQENLLICFLYLSLNDSNKKLRKEMKSIREYLNSVQGVLAKQCITPGFISVLRNGILSILKDF